MFARVCCFFLIALAGGYGSVWAEGSAWQASGPVSYTHLDVYKRQGVLLDMMRQVETTLLSRNYDGFLKKGKLKGKYGHIQGTGAAAGSRTDVYKRQGKGASGRPAGKEAPVWRRGLSPPGCPGSAGGFVPVP